MWYGLKSGIVARDWRLVELAKAFWIVCTLNTSTPPPPKDTKHSSFLLLILVHFGRPSIFLWSSFSSFWGWVGIFFVFVICGNGRLWPFHDFKIYNTIGLLSGFFKLFSDHYCLLFILPSLITGPHLTKYSLRIGMVLDTFKPHYLKKKNTKIRGQYSICVQSMDKLNFAPELREKNKTEKIYKSRFVFEKTEQRRQKNWVCHVAPPVKQKYMLDKIRKCKK